MSNDDETAPDAGPDATPAVDDNRLIAERRARR